MIKVLIADDEPLVRAGIKTVLPWNMYGFDVIAEAADGKEAYEKILKLKPDILITDIKMPGMDGITLLKRLKQEKISIQSLVLSCFDEFELVREAMKYGAHDYIRKLSIDPAKLLEVLKEMKEAVSDQPEQNASFSLNTDDLKYLFIKRLQNQGFEDHEQVENVLHNIKLDISIQDYHLIRFSFEPDTAPITDTNRKNLIYNLLNQICERYPGQELFSLDEKGYLLISNTKKDLLLCRQIGAAMKQYVNQTVYFGISPLLKDETSFKAGMKQAEEALSACIFYERSEPLPYPLLTSVGFPFITDSQAQELYIALSSGNSEKSSELVQRFLLWLKSGLFYPFQCYSYMEEILNIFIRVARELNFSLYQMTADENDILRRIRQAHTLQTCQKILSDFIMEFSELVRDKHSGERSEILKIKEYVQLHYSENIDLNLVAGLVNVTPSHLSNLFKKETGTNFSSYLTDVRMQAAGKLLKADADVLVFENQGYDNLKHRRTVFYVDKSYFVLVDEGIGEATGDLHLNFNLCENKDNVVLDAEQKGAHTSFADNNNIVIRTFAEDNNSITCQEKEGRFSFSSSANDGYKERIAYSIDMNKADNKTARFATVILPIEKYTEEKEISVTFGECTNNSISVNVTVAGETKTLSYTL